MGFTGKACIHPSQVDIINKAFEPTKEEKEEAMKVLQEYEKIGDQVLSRSMVKWLMNQLLKQ